MRSIAWLSVAFVACAAPIAAQGGAGPTSQGSMLVGGSANLSRTSASGQTSTAIGVQPDLLYFVANRVAIGGQLGLGYSDHTSGETTSWRLGPTARVYFGEQSKVLTYIGAAFHFGSATTSVDAPIATESEQSIRGLEGVAGLTFMISRQVGVVGEFFADRSKNTAETAAGAKVSTTITHYGLRFGFAAFLF